MADLAAVAVAGLLLALPSGFVARARTSEEVASPFIPGEKGVEEFASFAGPGGRELVVFVWLPVPMRDRGPMKAEREWSRRVAGEETRVVETSHFFGRPKRVLVTHLRRPSGGATALVYATGMEVEEFGRLLDGVRWDVAKGPR